MEWVKLSTSYDHDAAIMRAGEAAEVLFTRSLAYCGREETGGFIPDGMPDRICPKGTRARVNALVRERLWIRDNAQGGWWLRSWEGWQSELDVLAERRRNERERKRKERERRAQEVKVSRDMSRDSHVTGRGRGRSRNGHDDPTKVDLTLHIVQSGKSDTENGSASPDAGDIDAGLDQVSRDCPGISPARDREEREETKKTTTGPYSAQGRNARELDRAPDANQAQSLVEMMITEYRDNSPGPVSSKITSQLAEQCHQLLRDGFTADQIRHGLGQLRPRKAGPGLLAAIVDELANTEAPSNVIATRTIRADPRPSTTDARVNDALAMAAALREQEQQTGNTDDTI